MKLKNNENLPRLLNLVHPLQRRVYFHVAQLSCYILCAPMMGTVGVAAIEAAEMSNHSRSGTDIGQNGLRHATRGSLN